MVARDTNPYASPVAQSQPKRHSNGVAVAGRMVVFGCAGLCVGLLLTLAGVLAIESGGYGTPFFLLVYSAPCGLLPRGPIVLLASVASWTLLGTLAGGVNRHDVHSLLVVLLFIHYASIPIAVIANWNEIGGQSNFLEAMGSGGIPLLLSFPVYAVAQIFFWRLLLQGRSG